MPSLTRIYLEAGGIRVRYGTDTGLIRDGVQDFRNIEARTIEVQTLVAGLRFRGGWLNMYLRWMVRNDGRGVDIGLWKSIRPDQLICPFDLHVDRISRKLGAYSPKEQSDWLTALELTEALKKFDPVDTVRFDFALFGVGVHEFAGAQGLRQLSRPFKMR